MYGNIKLTCNNITDEEVTMLSEKAGISRLLSKVFLSRGINDIEYIKMFLKPSTENMHNPFMLKDMKKAVKRIKQSINNKESVVIYGDYDIDGITAVSMLYMFLKEHGVNVGFYIPDRLDEGYGLSIEAADSILKLQQDLVISVDCGVTAVDEVEYFKSKGMEIIITDHHECGDVLPDACAVVNPCRNDCDYPFKELSGAGVVYKLINAVCIEMGVAFEYKRYIELAALGTIGDVVSLTGENRILACYGIREIQNTSNIGLKKLLENSGIRNEILNSSTIGYVIGPRINAAGRMGDARRAVRLFITDNEKEAYEIVQDLNNENRLRQSIQEDTFKIAVDIIEKGDIAKKDKVIIVCGKGWHPGIIGIVASKITESYNRPSIVISDENGEGRGSCRSIKGFDISDALKYCGEFLKRYGGHELAAGLSIDMKMTEPFKKMINKYASNILDNKFLEPSLKIDAYLTGTEIDIKAVKELELLKPYGMGNPVPVFAVINAKIKLIKTVGDGRHLKLILDCKGNEFDAIGFNIGNLIENYGVNDIIDAVFSLKINSWNSSENVSMVLKHLCISNDEEEKARFLHEFDKYIEFEKTKDYNKVNEMMVKAGFEVTDEIIPERKDLAAVYMYLKNNCNKEQVHVIDDIKVFAKDIADWFKTDMNFFKAKKSIQIFEELELISSTQLAQNKTAVKIMENNGTKKDLQKSKIYRELQEIGNEIKAMAEKV